MPVDDSEEHGDRLVAATLYLMSCHARTGCPRLACLIERHMCLIGRHAGVTDRVRDIAQKLAASWTAIRRHDENRTLMARLEPGKKLH